MTIETGNKKSGRRLLFFAGVFLLFIFLLGFVPLVIPIPDPDEAVPAASLADANSRFIELNGYDLHYQEMGSGEPVFLLLHGLGPGLFTWHEVMEPLSHFGRVIAIDRPAAGLSERPLGDELADQNPYTAEFQADLILALMDSLQIERVHLVGNSAGGTLAVYTVLQAPERFASLTLVDAAVYSGGGAPAFVQPLLRTPQLRRMGPFFVRSLFEEPLKFLESAYADDAKISEETIEGYRKLSTIENWDLAFWELSLAGKSLHLAEQLENLPLPVLVISGDTDEIVPIEDSQRLADEIPGASLVILLHCGHLPQEECPDGLLEAIIGFVSETE